jgi:hypothetical protein
VTLSLRRHLVARGKVSVEDEFADCAASVPVKIQRRKAGGGWKTVRFTTTSSTGSYRKRIPDRLGKYRAVAPAVLENGEVCFKAVSPRVRHHH